MTLLPFESLGLDEHVAKAGPAEAMLEIAARACRSSVSSAAIVPFGFPSRWPTGCAPAGSSSTSTVRSFAGRRRVKTPRQLEGIRRAQVAAEAGTRAAADAPARADGGRRRPPPRRRAAHLRATQAGGRRGVLAQRRHGRGFHRRPWRADLHRPPHGLGPDPRRRADHRRSVAPRRGVEVHTDMTRTFVVGPVSDELADYHRLCQEVHDRVIPAIRPGATGRDCTARLRGGRRGAAIPPSSRRSRARCCSTASSTASATVSGWRCTRIRTLDLRRRRARRGRRRRRRAGLLPAGLRRRAARGPRARDRRRRRDPHALPVRA